MLTTIATLARLALWIFKALGWANNLSERRDGAAENELDATNAEINRVNDAADAGLNASKLPIDTPDPYDEGRK